MARDDKTLGNGTSGTILVVEDELAQRETLCAFLGEEYTMLEAGNGTEALAHARENAVDLVFLDLRLGREDGLDILKRLREESPGLPVIMLTAHGTPEHAFTAYRHGAVHFMSKPYKLDELKERVRYEFEAAALRREKEQLEGVRAEFAGQPLLGQSGELKRVLEQIAKIAKLSTSTVLIKGETGVGKELVAQQLHVQSPRGQGPFVELNCSAVPENLLESELFGFERGAFTDAKRQKKGVFEMAQGGTLFLDEIGEMSLALQSKLLKVLESKTFRRLGGTVDITVDTRVVAATNRDLRREVDNGRFREDLYFRLQVIPIDVPALRARRADIPLLLRHFVERFAREIGRPSARLHPEAERLLVEYAWPGNVRELRNVIERIVLLESDDEIRPEHLPLEIVRPSGAGLGTSGVPGSAFGAPAGAGAGAMSGGAIAGGMGGGASAGGYGAGAGASTGVGVGAVGTAGGAGAAGSGGTASGIWFAPGLVVPLAAVEMRAIQHALACEKGNKTRAAQALGISRQTLRTKLKEYALEEGADEDEGAGP
ncbi:MAG: sigma-54-dependent transcriptional regulator [Candidatus Eiseniibacteriota bacterium]